MPTFTPPFVLDNSPLLPNTRGPAFFLFRHYKNRARGRTVIKKNGVYSTVDAAAVPDQLATADIVYLGGHIYEVTESEAADLVAAGYTVIGYPVATSTIPYPSLTLYPAADLYPRAI